jgi:hypothetical protein
MKIMTVAILVLLSGCTFSTKSFVRNDTGRDLILTVGQVYGDSESIKVFDKVKMKPGAVCGVWAPTYYDKYIQLDDLPVLISKIGSSTFLYSAKEVEGLLYLDVEEAKKSFIKEHKFTGHFDCRFEQE